MAYQQEAQAVRPPSGKITINHLLQDLHAHLSEHADEVGMLGNHLEPIRNRIPREQAQKDAPLAGGSFVETVILEAIRRVQKSTETLREIRSEIALEPERNSDVECPEPTYPQTSLGAGAFRPGRP